MVEHEARHLEQEVFEAVNTGRDFSELEDRPLLLILYRLGHQDKALSEIKSDLHSVTEKLNTHIVEASETNESVIEMVTIWKGSKLMAKVASWFIGICAALAAAYATAKKNLIS